MCCSNLSISTSALAATGTASVCASRAAQRPSRLRTGQVCIAWMANDCVKILIASKHTHECFGSQHLLCHLGQCLARGPPTLTAVCADALLVATGTDPFQLVHDAVVAAASLSGGALALQQKTIPASADVFGWCTWDAFYSSVSAKGACGKASVSHMCAYEQPCLIAQSQIMPPQVVFRMGQA